MIAQPSIPSFSKFDIKLPRTSIEQSKTGTDLGKNTDDAKRRFNIFQDE
jgi:hypothetical protein